MTKNPYLFQGRRLDAESGLYYFRNRQYDPVHGRFLTRDPMGYEDSYCLYQFVNNNPINYTDPDGLRHVRVSTGVENSLVYDFEVWLEFDTDDSCTASTPPVGDYRESATVTVAVTGVNVQGPTKYLKKTQNSCCPEVECYQYYVHMIAVQGIGISVSKGVGISAWLEINRHNYYVTLRLCANDNQGEIKMSGDGSFYKILGVDSDYINYKFDGGGWNAWPHDASDYKKLVEVTRASS